MALTSSSTFAQALAQLNNSLAWEGSPSKAVDALEAIRWLRANRPQQSSTQGTQLNYESLKDQEEKLSDYVSGVGATALANRSAFVRARFTRPYGGGSDPADCR